MYSKFSYRLAVMPLAQEGEELSSTQRDDRIEALIRILRADLPKLSKLAWSTIEISEVVVDGCLCAAINLSCKAYMGFSMPDKEAKTIRAQFLREVQAVLAQRDGASDRIQEAISGARQPGESLEEGDDSVTVADVRRRVRDGKREFSRVVVPTENDFIEIDVGELPVFAARGDAIEISARVSCVKPGTSILENVSITSGDRSRVSSIPGIQDCRKLRRQRMSPMHVDHGTALQRAMDLGLPVKLLVVLCLRWVDGVCDSFVLVEDQAGLQV